MRARSLLLAGLVLSSCQFATDFNVTYDGDGPPTAAALSDFEFGIDHRDDVVVDDLEWLGDHVENGPNDRCTGPTTKRTIERGVRAQGFNDDWIYVCVPGGDPAKAHVMTSIGDTSGYSIGSFTPAEVSTDVTEVRWDVNITDLGLRQWTEVKIVPVDAFDFEDLPCAHDLPCDNSEHGDLGSVGTSFFDHRLAIHNGTELADNGVVWGSPFFQSGDPAVSDLAERRSHIFADNGDGTLSFSIEQADGSFYEFTMPGAFPSGPVRVVFSDHNYTPNKDTAAGFPDGDGDGIADYTWHWDNIAIS